MLEEVDLSCFHSPIHCIVGETKKHNQFGADVFSQSAHIGCLLGASFHRMCKNQNSFLNIRHTSPYC